MKVATRALTILLFATSVLAAPAPAAATDGCSSYYLYQQDDYVTAASGYRLHGWLRADQCLKGIYPFEGWQRRYVMGQDSRYCDGCATHNVTTTRMTGKAWYGYNAGDSARPGHLAYDNTLTLSNTWKVNLVTPWLEHDNYNDDRRASASGYQAKTGIFTYSWFRQYIGGN